LIDALQGLVERLENDPSFFEPNRLHERLEALNFLDAYVSDAPQRVFGDELYAEELNGRARAIYARLEAANCELYGAIRNEIQRGIRPEALLQWASSAKIVDTPGPLNGVGYDDLDELISGIFQFEEPDEGSVKREPEKVFYQPTPARHIFSLIGQTALTEEDVLVDLGSGLGHVPLLVSICTPARSLGIELEATYVERAQECAQNLRLNRVTFFHQDARAADLSAGTVFYLYTPFTGSVLHGVVTLLRSEAKTRRIRICTYGPCTSVVAQETWLETTTAPETNRIVMFSSRS
jgi:hypothetical protein